MVLLVIDGARRQHKSYVIVEKCFKLATKSDAPCKWPMQNIPIICYFVTFQPFMNAF